MVEETISWSNQEIFPFLHIWAKPFKILLTSETVTVSSSSSYSSSSDQNSSLKLGKKNRPNSIRRHRRQHPSTLRIFFPTNSSSLLISLVKHDFNYLLSRKIWLKRKLRRQWRDRPIWSPSEKRKLRGQWRDCLILRGSEYQRKDLYKVKIRDSEQLHGSDCSCKEGGLMRKIGGDRRYRRESEMVINVCVSTMGTKQVKLMSRLELIMCTD